MDEQLSLKLDEEFKVVLKNIRPYIVQLTNPNYITSCRVWMEKLSMCLPEESGARNDYLAELYRQIQNEKIEEPFLSAPPDGPLLDLNLPGSSTSWSDISSTTSIGETTEVPCTGDSQPKQTTPNERHNYSSFYEDKIHNQQLLIEDLRQKNNMLSEQLSQFASKINSRIKNSKAELGINVMSSEVEYLKERLRELIMMNKNLQASHNAMALQWEEATRTLEYELRTERQKNNDLITKIEHLESNVNIIKNCSGDCVLKENYTGNFKQEIGDLQDKHNQIIKYMEEQHDLILKAKEKEYSEKITELQISHKNEIEKIKAETQQTCKIKDEEISRLEKIAEEQCDRMHQEVVFIRSQLEKDAIYGNETLMEKVGFLQKCIVKMEKLLRKYEKHYTKKIHGLTSELQMKDNAMQIKLTTQRAQLMSKVSTERQTEIEEIVSQLELKYRVLLENQQEKMSDVRQEYSNIINKLIDKFDLNSIST